MELTSSDEEECQVGFWDNWIPPTVNPVDEVRHKLCEIKNAKPVKVASDFSTQPPVMAVENPKFGNWIPPLNFLNAAFEVKNQKQFQREKEVEVSKTRKNSWTQSTQCTTLGRKVNLDWGERSELHDVIKMNNGDLIWGVVHLGVFANIKIWVNEYGNICCSASGKISKLGSSEMTFISITDTQLLRKMLSISSAQWASLCETIKETSAVLKFDAFQDYELRGKTSLERLWFFICKRRHFLPKKCMLLKLCGAIKCMKEFNVTPKLLVQDIRNLSGEAVL